MTRSVPCNVTNTVVCLKTMTSRIKTRALIGSCSHMIGGVCFLTLHIARALEIYSAFLGSEGEGGWMLGPAGIGSGRGDGD